MSMEMLSRISSQKRFTLSYFIADLGFASEDALEEYVTKDEDIFGAIVFVFSDDSEILPARIIYKIRLRSDKMGWITNAMFPDLNTNGPRNDGLPGACICRRQLIINLFSIFLFLT